MERRLLVAGVAPRELDALTFRMAMQILRAEADREQRRLQRLAFLGSIFANYGAAMPKKPVRPKDLIPAAFGEGRARLSREALDDAYARHKQRLARERSHGNNR